MPVFKRCPVCGHMLRSYGKKTCGGTDCIKTWKSWSAAVQYQAMLQAENPNSPIINKPNTIEPASPLSPEDQLSSPEANEFIKNILKG